MIEKIVYIIHEYGGRKENYKAVEELTKTLVSDYPNYCFISGILTFGCLYKEVPYQQGIDYCLSLLDLCDEAWCYGDKSTSTGCIIEKDYCRNYDIPLIERVRK